MTTQTIREKLAHTGSILLAASLFTVFISIRVASICLLTGFLLHLMHRPEAPPANSAEPSPDDDTASLFV